MVKKKLFNIIIIIKNYILLKFIFNKINNFFKKDYCIIITEELKGRFCEQKNNLTIKEIKIIIKKWVDFQLNYLHYNNNNIKEFYNEKKIYLPNIIQLLLNNYDDKEINEDFNINNNNNNKIYENIIKIQEKWINCYNILKNKIKYNNKEKYCQKFIILIDKFYNLDFKKIYYDSIINSYNNIQSIIHNDFRADHFCFLNNNDLYIIDWQTVCFGKNF
jgi:hypothetical protein